MQTNPPSASLSLSDRFFRVLESGMTQTLLGIVGGLAGTFLDGRYFVILSPMIPAAIHRSKALEGIDRPWSTVWIVLSIPTTIAILFWCGIYVNESRNAIYTPRDYAAAVKKIIPSNTTVSTSEVITAPTTKNQESGPPILLPQISLVPYKPPVSETGAWGLPIHTDSDLRNQLITRYQRKNHFSVFVDINYLRGDRDSYDFANQLGRDFTNGGWNVKMIGSPEGSYQEGLLFLVNSVEVIPFGLQELQYAACQGAVVYQTEETSTISYPQFSIFVGKVQTRPPKSISCSPIPPLQSAL